jgi:hypothetical protein
MVSLITLKATENSAENTKDFQNLLRENISNEFFIFFSFGPSEVRATSGAT